MDNNPRKIVIIGGGIAGLCAAVYAQSCGYQAEVLEMHDIPGGLATSWHRSGYTFETCLHWLLGSNPESEWYARWLEVLDIDKLHFINPREFVRLEDEHGQTLRIPSNIDHLETELLARAPEDWDQVLHFTSAIRSLARFELPDPSEGLSRNWLTLLRDVPYLPLLHELSSISAREYGEKFKNPLLKAFFGDGSTAKMSTMPLVFSLAWMSQRNAGYPIGGSQAIIRLIVDRLASLGGQLRLGAKVDRILVEKDTAVGVQLTSGEIIQADWVISAADGHTTIYDLLGGRYTDRHIDSTYEEFEPFPSYLQVSLGIARDLPSEPGFLIRLLDTPLQVDPSTQLSQVSFRIFGFDPTFAPPGKTPVTCFLPTYNYDYWSNLRQNRRARYWEEKHRIAEKVISILEARMPGIRSAIEIIDVSTPATVIHLTGNWKGSMEGWLPTPHTGVRQLRNTLPGLQNFIMVGQWVAPGGGLPSGLLTARQALHNICEQDIIPFTPHARVTAGKS